MRYLKFLLTLTALIFVGCSSGEKQSETSVEEMSEQRKPVEKSKYSVVDNALNRKDYNKLLQVAQENLSSDPYDAKTLNALAIMHIRKGQYGAAQILLEKALKKNKVAGLENNLGVIEMLKGNPEGAFVRFQKAAEMSSDDSDALNKNLGSFYLYYGDKDKVEDLINENTWSGFTGLKAMNNYAVYLRQIGQFEKAESIYKKALGKSSRNTTLLLNYTILLVDYMKKYNEGERLLNKLEFLELNGKGLKAKIENLHQKVRAAKK